MEIKIQMEIRRYWKKRMLIKTATFNVGEIGLCVKVNATKSEDLHLIPGTWHTYTHESTPIINK